MIKRTVGSGAVLVALAAALAGCSSSSHAATKPRASTTTSKAAATTSTTKMSTTTIAVTSTSVVPDTRPPTTGPGSGPTTPPPPDAETAAKRFFAAWIAHDLGGMVENGTGRALNEATAQYAHTTGTPWVLSNCQGAAGSQYCTWVRAAEDVVVRASDVSPVNLAVEFQYHALQPLDIAEQFVNAWEFGGSSALGVLGTSQAAAQAQALNAQRGDGWQAPASCEGTAGSFYCTFTAGTKKFVLQVGDVQLPRQVRSVTYTS